VAIREYLEIDPRIKVLNERCRVFLDLAEILSDSVADARMSYITWIIIVLIVVSILVTVTEVTMRFGILEKQKKAKEGEGLAPLPSAGPDLELRSSGGGGEMWNLDRVGNFTLDELRAFGAKLSEQEQAAVCGADIVGTTFAGA